MLLRMAEASRMAVALRIPNQADPRACIGRHRDAVGCAMAGQKVPDGYYHLDRMIESAARHGAEVGCCGTCMDARGIGANAHSLSATGNLITAGSATGP